MKILFISNYSKLYGANRSLMSIMEKCQDSGYDVCLFLPTKGDLALELKRKGIKFKAIPYFSSLFYYEKLWRYLAVPALDLWTLCIFPYIIYKAKKYQPDLIYSNSTADNIGIILARVLGVKHITHVRDFMDLDHGLNFIFGRKAKKKYICYSDGVIYVSKSVANHLLMDDHLPNNHKVIYNGVREPKDEFIGRFINPNINFGIVGLLDEGKCQDMAIRYFNKIKEDFPLSKLHIWGDKEGSFKMKLIKLIEEYHLQERVVMHGFEKNPSVIYNNMHALLMCSRSEGFGRVTVEAMMRGIPVIGYNSGGTAEIVKHGFNGYIFSTEEEFVEDVHNLFSSDKNYNKLCLNAYNDSRERFSEEKYTNNVKNFIINIIK